MRGYTWYAPARKPEWSPSRENELLKQGRIRWATAGIAYRDRGARVDPRAMSCTNRQWNSVVLPQSSVEKDVMPNPMETGMDAEAVAGAADWVNFALAA